MSSRRTLGLGIGALALTAGIGLAWTQRERLAFVRDLSLAYVEGRRFYHQYEYVAQDIPIHPEMVPRLDVYSPPAGEGHPVLIFFHGGAWSSYHKGLFVPVAMRIVPHEMVVVIPDYSLFPGARYEQMATEVAGAIAWTLEHIEDYGGDPERVVVAGHSAGAHLLGLATMDSRFLSAQGHSSEELCGLIGLSGVYDVQAEYDFWLAKGSTPRLITGVFGGEEHFGPASPLSHVRAGLPPWLLIHGDHDESVPVEMSIEFAAALREAGAPVALKVYPGAAHSDYFFAGLRDEGAQVLRDIVTFVQRCR